MKNCATCINLRRKCNGECGMCEHSVQMQGEKLIGEKTASKASKIFSERGRMIDASRERIAFRYEAPNYSAECKCMVCYDEDSGRYKYWEENKEVTRLLETGDKDD